MWAAAVFMALLQVTRRVGGQPLEDDCFNAVQVSSLPFSETSSTVGAIPGFSNVACDVANSSPGVWYEYTPTKKEVIKLTVDLPVLTYFKLGMSVYTGTCDNLTCVDKTDYTPPDLGKSLTWTAEAGATHYIRVSSLTSTGVGSFQIDLELVKTPNYDCSDATEIPSLPFSTLDTTEGSDVQRSVNVECNDAVGSPGVWYKFTPSENQVNMVTIDTGSVLENIIRVGISVYSGTCEGLLCVTGNGYSTAEVGQTLPWAASAGTTYYIRVSSEDSGEVGPFRIDIETLVPPDNQDCNGAETISSVPFKGEGNTVGAFPQFADAVCGIDEGSQGVWFKYRPSSDFVHFASMLPTGFSLNPETHKLVFSLHDGACDNLSCEIGGFPSGPIGFLSAWCNEASCGIGAGVGNTIYFAGYADTTYYFHIHGKTLANVGPFDISTETLERPPNDACSTAQTITAGNSVVQGVNNGAVPDRSFSGPGCRVVLGTRALWYSVTAAASGGYKATVKNYDDFIVLSLFSGDCGSLVCIKSEIVPFEGVEGDFFPAIELEWTASAGSTYYLVIHGQDGFKTDFGFQMEVTGPGFVAPGPTDPPGPTNPPGSTDPPSPTSPPDQTDPPSSTNLPSGLGTVKCSWILSLLLLLVVGWLNLLFGNL